jgi:hypothetical protein
MVYLIARGRSGGSKQHPACSIRIPWAHGAFQTGFICASRSSGMARLRGSKASFSSQTSASVASPPRRRVSWSAGRGTQLAVPPGAAVGPAMAGDTRAGTRQAPAATRRSLPCVLAVEGVAFGRSFASFLEGNRHRTHSSCSLISAGLRYAQSIGGRYLSPRWPGPTSTQMNDTRHSSAQR